MSLLLLGACGPQRPTFADDAGGACESSCGTAECGFDLCGVSCGTCAAGGACEDGVCVYTCTDSCEAGDVFCSGGGVKRCVRGENGCYSFTVATPCDDGFACADGECIERCDSECVLGVVRCSGEQLQTCVQGGRCTRWDAPVDCEIGRCVGEGECRVPCVDACVFGSVQCSGDLLQTCGRVDGCTAWEAPVACTEGVCVHAGECVVPCSDQCVTGAQRCGGDAIERCDLQASGCTDWGSGGTCAMGACRNNAQCVSPCVHACRYNEERCSASGGRETCAIGVDGCWAWEANPCPRADRCVAGRCEAASCLTTCPAGLTCTATGGICEGPLTGIVLRAVKHRVTGTIRVNGQVPYIDPLFCDDPDNDLRRVGIISFRSSRLNSESPNFELKCENGVLSWDFDVRVRPGSYRVTASVYDLGDNNVAAGGTFSLPEVVVSGPLSGLVLDQPVAYPVSGRILLNGRDPPLHVPTCVAPSQGAYSFVYFEGRAGSSNRSFVAVCTENATQLRFSGFVPAGEYAVVVSPARVASDLPEALQWSEFRAFESLVVNGPRENLLLNATTYPVSGRITVNGQTPVFSTNYCGLAGNRDKEFISVHLSPYGQGTAAYFRVRCVAGVPDFTFSGPVHAGRYRVAAYLTNGVEGLLNTSLQHVTYFDDLLVNGPIADLVLDQRVHAVAGRVQVNGRVPVFTSEDDCRNVTTQDVVLARVGFSDPERGQTVTHEIRCVNGTASFNVNLRLVEGSYNVSVTRGDHRIAQSLNLGPISYQTLTGVVVAGPVSGLLFNQVQHRVTGTIQVNGQSPLFNVAYCASPGNAGKELLVAEFTLLSRGSKADHVVACRDGTASFDFGLTLPAGTYSMALRPGAFATAAGLNVLPRTVVVGTGVDVSAPVSGLVLNETYNPLSGTVELDSAVVATFTSFCADPANDRRNLIRVDFVPEGISNAGQQLALNCRDRQFFSNFTVSLSPGIYSVVASDGQDITQAGVARGTVDFGSIDRLRVP